MAYRQGQGLFGPEGLNANLKEALNPSGTTNKYTQQAQSAPQDMIYDSSSGLYMDPKTNTVYQVQNDGTYQPVRDLNLTAQVARNIQVANIQAQNANVAHGEYEQALTGQKGLASALQTTISDPNAPSVAREQLNQTLGANTAAQLGLASGASGENALIAREDAARNIAALNTKAGQDAATLRAQEVAGAQQNLGGVLQNEAANATGLQQLGTQTGLGYSQLSGSESGAGLANDTAQRGQNIDIGKSIATGAGSLGSAAITKSDRRAKKDIAPEPSEKIRAFLDAIRPDSFKYKGEDESAPDHHGVMAQDLEKSEIGRSLVRDTPGGKMVDVGQAAMAALAAVAHIYHDNTGSMRPKAKKGGGRHG